MSNRPILMSAPMVRALIDGRKTQTRRIVKPQPSDYRVETVAPQRLRGEPPKHERPYFDAYNGGPHWCWWDEYDRQGADWIKCPYGVGGDLLIVRETHWRWGHWRKDGLTKAGHQRWRFVALDKHLVAYCLPDDKRLATATCYPGMDRETVGYWKRPSLFMPRTASRLTLEITDIRVERLQDISAADAVAEGIERPGIGAPFWKSYRPDPVMPTLDPVRSYAGLWEAINGPGSWAADPWVWAVSFKVFHANVDQMLAQIGDNPNG